MSNLLVIAVLTWVNHYDKMLVMKNILKESPTEELHGRYIYSTKFCSSIDIKDKEILDIGCGFGWFEYFAYRNNANRIIGIEPEAKNLDIPKSFFKARKVLPQKVSFQVGSALDIPFKKESFDTVVAWEVLEHLPKLCEGSMFKEVYRVLKPKGVFYMSTPYNHWLSNITDPAWIFGHRHYSLSFLNDLAVKSGFRVVESRVIGGWSYILWSINMYIAKWIFRRRIFFPRIFKKAIEEDFSKEGVCSVYMKLQKVNEE
jgi:SAM-dependent methyltransferase